MGSSDENVKTWVIKDHLSREKGGDGEVWATNLDKIQFYGPFSLKIGKNFVGEDVTNSTPADKKVELINYQPFWDQSESPQPAILSKLKNIDGSGNLISQVGSMVQQDKSQ